MKTTPLSAISQGPRRRHGARRAPISALFGLGLLLLALSACGSDGGGGSDCAPGELQCPCRDDGTCDDGLECRQGFCVPAGQPGGLGDDCGPEQPCGEHDGAALECVGGVCRLPGCTPGSLGCECTPAGGCDDGLVCDDSVCRAAEAQGVTVGAPDVRACDVVLPGAGLAVTFADTVEGVSLRRGGRLAFSFAAKADAALTEPVATLLSADGGAAPTPETVECWDRLGRPVATPQLDFQ